MNLSRREFLIATGGALVVSTIGRAQTSSATVITVAYNILGCRGYPRNKYTEAALDAAAPTMHLRIADALAETGADIVTLSESPEEARVAAIAERLGFDHVFFPGGWPGDDQYPGGFPGAILSRYPIRDAVNCPVAGEHDPELFTRHFGRAVVDTPHGSLNVFTVHLFPNDAVALRIREIEAVLAAIESAPASELGALVQGDLNHAPDSEEYEVWTHVGLTDTFATRGEGDGPTFSSARARWRIDYIWAHGKIADGLRSAATLNSPPFATDPDDRSAFALSDHLPVEATFELP